MLAPAGKFFIPKKEDFMKKRILAAFLAVLFLLPMGACSQPGGGGKTIEGTVEDSILFPGVVVERGAQVQGCILMKGTVVHKNSVLHNVISDKDVEIMDGRTLMGHASYPLVIAKGSKI